MVAIRSWASRIALPPEQFTSLKYAGLIGRHAEHDGLVAALEDQAGGVLGRIRAAVRAERAGFVREGEVRDAAWGRIVQLADPFGHGWCLIAFSAHGYDAIADRD